MRDDAGNLGRKTRSVCLPGLIQGHGYNIEGLVSLAPQVIFSYASMDRSELAQFEKAGIPVVAVRGETFEESFEAVRLISDVLGCPDAGQTYITACKTLLDEVAARLENNLDTPVPVLFAGPRSVYSVATGNMLQTEILTVWPGQTSQPKAKPPRGHATNNTATVQQRGMVRIINVTKGRVCAFGKMGKTSAPVHRRNSLTGINHLPCRGCR